METKQIPVACGIIYNEEGQLLIAKRYQPDDPDFHNKWEMLGGGIELHETPEEAVIREIKEETGYDVDIVQLLPKAYTYTRVFPEKTVKLFFYTFICKIIGGQQHTDDPEIGELKFIEPKDILNYECVPIVQEAVLLAESLKS